MNTFKYSKCFLLFIVTNLIYLHIIKSSKTSYKFHSQKANSADKIPNFTEHNSTQNCRIKPTSINIQEVSQIFSRDSNLTTSVVPPSVRLSVIKTPKHQLRSTIDWDWQSTEIINQLRSTGSILSRLVSLFGNQIVKRIWEIHFVDE